MKVIDAKDRFLARMPQEAAAEARAGMELQEAESWPHFNEPAVQRILGAILLECVHRQLVMSTACAYAIAVKVIYGIGAWTPPTPLPPLDK